MPGEPGAVSTDSFCLPRAVCVGHVAATAGPRKSVTLTPSLSKVTAEWKSRKSILKCLLRAEGGECTASRDGRWAQEAF